MAWFYRSDKQRSGVRDYIRNTNSVSRPMALLFTAIIFIVGVAVVFSLVWGGRWAYDKIAGNKNNNPVTVTSSQKAPTQPSTSSSGNQNQKPNTSNNSNATANQSPNTGPSSSEVPNTGPTPTVVPNTGPEPE